MHEREVRCKSVATIITVIEDFLHKSGYSPDNGGGFVPQALTLLDMKGGTVKRGYHTLFA